jgi:FKBP-type peptidyl-prolyl cis-trans isomerase
MKRLCGSILVLVLTLAAGCADPAPEKPKKTQGGVGIEDLKEGDGAEVKRGDWVKVHYTGWLEEGGKKFDSSHDRQEPFVFQVGQGVIDGWSRGVVGMKVGGKRKLFIPADLGYGARGAGPDIPPNANLVFEVEVLGIEEGPPPRKFGDE